MAPSFLKIPDIRASLHGKLELDLELELNVSPFTLPGQVRSPIYLVLLLLGIIALSTTTSTFRAPWTFCNVMHSSRLNYLIIFCNPYL